MGKPWCKAGVLAHLRLRQAFIPLDVLKHVASRDILHCNGKVLRREENLLHAQRAQSNKGTLSPEEFVKEEGWTRHGADYTHLELDHVGMAEIGVANDFSGDVLSYLQ